MKLLRKNEKGGAGVVALLLVILILAVGTAVLVIMDNGSIGKSTNMDAVKITTDDKPKTEESSSEPEPVVTEEPVKEPEPETLKPAKSADYKEVNAKKITSKYCILVDADKNEIIAGSGYDTKIYPASLTKLLTLLVAVENVEDTKATFKFTDEILDPLIEQDASRVGFEPGEKVTIKDMLYGAILCSGADATSGLAITVAGSEKDFAAMMNEKAKELGMENTHFTNASGLYDKKHVTTCEDMAILMKAVLANKTCKKIISTETYTTSKTEEHPDGITIDSIVFHNIYSYGKDPDFEIGGGKTGYTDESGTLIATYLEYEGKTYIAVTAKALGQDEPVLDTEYLYHTYVVEPLKKANEKSDESKDESSDESKDESSDESKEEKSDDKDKKEE